MPIRASGRDDPVTIPSRPSTAPRPGSTPRRYATRAATYETSIAFGQLQSINSHASSVSDSNADSNRGGRPCTPTHNEAAPIRTATAPLRLRMARHRWHYFNSFVPRKASRRHRSSSDAAPSNSTGIVVVLGSSNFAGVNFDATTADQWKLDSCRRICAAVHSLNPDRSFQSVAALQPSTKATNVWYLSSGRYILGRLPSSKNSSRKFIVRTQSRCKEHSRPTALYIEKALIHLDLWSHHRPGRP